MAFEVARKGGVARQSISAATIEKVLDIEGAYVTLGLHVTLMPVRPCGSILPDKWKWVSAMLNNQAYNDQARAAPEHCFSRQETPTQSLNIRPSDQ